MHCYFVLSGDSSLPILYHVERVRDGKSFATRTVQARQQGRPIFTTTLSFDREGSGGDKLVEHSTAMPKIDNPPPASRERQFGNGPFESIRGDVVGRMYSLIASIIAVSRDRELIIYCAENSRPEEKAVRQFIRARDPISKEGGLQAHLSALAYMSDSYFIGTVSRVQDIPRFSSPEAFKSAIKLLKNPSDLDADSIVKYHKDLAEQEARELEAGGAVAPGREIGMMVSLDHTIYFHKRRGFRADEWMFTEMASPWAGAGRGLVMQKIWSLDGTLIATCVQEVSSSQSCPTFLDSRAHQIFSQGVVRLKQDKPPKNKL
jgi:acyl-CoA thioesterase II